MLKKAKTFLSAGKVTGTICWGSKGMLLIDYFGTNYAARVDKVKVAITEKRPTMARTTVLFHRVNVPSHTSRSVRKMDELRLHVVPQPACSADVC